ncbi:fimbrial protein [Candidatus Pantoea multigeneris]|uniref:Fimbrial protein n=1 Tax=Candidatus Pantoea multigeneris TaxID=2608357 RepID=A0ABX0RBC7_9GAMM|nr:fimbrial protein [Pantoea multigeneris]NIF22655.1 fimbrial protein [Pantoea multigeneris]
MLKKFKYLVITLVGLVFCLFSPLTWALSCVEASTGSLSQLINIDKDIQVSTATLQAGTILWRSQNYTSTFKCSDTNNYPGGEDAYLYWDPQSELRSIDPSIQVGVTYNSVNITLIPGQRNDVGPGTSCRRSGFGCASPARSLTVTVSYSVFIKATGSAPPASGRIANNGKYAVFQVDGVLGLNSTPNSNFRAYITGLGNIRFISCQPQISVAGNNGSIVNFGTIRASNAVAGVTEKQVPFSVVANLTGTGQDCQGQTLMASFSTTYPTSGTDMLMPTSSSGFGISISPASAPTSFIPFNTSTLLGYANGQVVQNDFVASLRWINSSPAIGTFNASANVDVTFK